LFGWGGRFSICGIFGLSNLSPLDFEQRIDCLLTVPQDRTQLRTAPISRTNNLSQRNGGSGQIGADGAAQEPLLVEDANFTQITRVDTERYRFSDISCEGR
jgi:hypothetical protein